MHAPPHYLARRGPGDDLPQAPMDRAVEAARLACVFVGDCDSIVWERKGVMAQISGDLSGCNLRSVSRDTSHGKLRFRANLTRNFVKVMGWSDLGSGQTGCTMEGTIKAAALILTADQENLFADGEFRAGVQTVGKFEITRMELKNKRQKGFRFVLDFEAQFVEEGIAAAAEAWIIKSGSGTGKLNIKGLLAEPEPEAATQDAEK
jgi:hypothetical protein